MENNQENQQGNTRMVKPKPIHKTNPMFKQSVGSDVENLKAD